MSILYRWFAIVGAFLLVSCQEDSEENISLKDQLWEKIRTVESQSEYTIPLDTETLGLHNKNTAVLREKVPQNFPEPYLPYGRLDSKVDPGLSFTPWLSKDLIDLGEKLFFDDSLSYSHQDGFVGGVSCASCHQEDRGFADTVPLSIGVDGEETTRNSPGLANVAYFSSLTWIPIFLPVLEKQADIPLFGDDPVEMGLRGKEWQLPDVLKSKDPLYEEMFDKAFAKQSVFKLNQDNFNYFGVTAALAAFQRSLIFFDNPVDKILQGKQGSLSESQIAGLKLFYGLSSLESGQKLECAQCHAGFNFSDSYQYVRNGQFFFNQPFHKATENDDTLFRTPSLRNLALTAPYGHDGSLPNIEDVVGFYEKGKRFGVKSFDLSQQERERLISFLKGL